MLDRAIYRYIVLSFALAVAALLIAYSAVLQVRNVAIDVNGTPEIHRTNIALPFIRPRRDNQTEFTVTADLNASALSSGAFRILPFGCIDTISINGTLSPELKTLTRAQQCYPFVYLIDVTPYLKESGNSITLKMTGAGKRLGIDMMGIYNYGAMMAIIACVILSAWVCLFAVLPCVSIPRRYKALCSGMLASSAFLPVSGVLATYAMLRNALPETGVRTWRDDQGLPSLAALCVAVILLLRILDNDPAGRLLSKRFYMPALISIAAFAYSLWIVWSIGWCTHQSTWLGVLGIISGVFAFVPFKQVISRIRHNPIPFAITVLAACCPQAIYSLRIPIWGYIAGGTATILHKLLQLCGLTVTMSLHEERENNGHVVDMWAYIATKDFSIDVATFCSGIEGVFLFCFLLSFFILLDWRFFKKVRHLWEIYVLTVPLVLTLNVFRIAALFIYGNWYAIHYKKTTAAWLTISAFHNNAGWIIYALAFAVFLPFVYRWGRDNAEAN